MFQNYKLIIKAFPLGKGQRTVAHISVCRDAAIAALFDMFEFRCCSFEVDGIKNRPKWSFGFTTHVLYDKKTNQGRYWLC